MTKQEITEGNVIIANYLGQHKYGDYYDVERHEYPDNSSFFENATDSIYHKSNLLYHYHYDWIEDAIEKIKTEAPDFDYDKQNIERAFIQVVEYITNLRQ